jgi:hypothetical protein
MKAVRFHKTGGPEVLVYEAHRLLEGRKTTGKAVLQPWVDA